MKKAAVIFFIAVIVLAGLAVAGFIRPPIRSGPVPSCCQPGGKCTCSPFGSYCKGRRWGWYGANKAVKSAGEAEAAIKRYYFPEKVNIARITGKSTFFEAQVKDSTNRPIDTVIVDKRTGRISSIY